MLVLLCTAGVLCEALAGTSQPAGLPSLQLPQQHITEICSRLNLVRAGCLAEWQGAGVLRAKDV